MKPIKRKHYFVLFTCLVLVCGLQFVGGEFLEVERRNNIVISRSVANLLAIALPDSEYDALFDLYNSTNGPEWDWRNIAPGSVAWQFEEKVDPCTADWEGLHCSIVGSVAQPEYSVTKIILPARNLQGTIPPTIDALKNLERIDLTYNQINGTVPSSFASMGSLGHIGLTGNSLCGTVPLFLTNLSSIKHIGIDYNSLTGTIPCIWRNDTQLTALLLSHNSLRGTIPSTLGSLRRLQFLYLNHNNLYGTIPNELGNLTDLAYFDLDANSLTGTIPCTFANLKRLRFLGLHRNQLTGTIPSFLGDMTNLQFLYLNNERFTGTIPESLSNLSHLLFLHLQYNRLSGTIPASLSRLPRIQYLYLNNNGLRGTIPRSLSQLTTLESLLVQNNDLTGSLAGVFNHTIQGRLRTVQVSHNVFTGELPEELFRLPQLVTLVAVSTCFHGSLPAAVCEAQALETMVLDGLHASPSCEKIIIPGFNGRPSHGNTFRGKVPSCLFNLSRLNTLHLSGNGLSGNLASDIIVGEHLLDLDLSHNILSGPIPEQIQNKVWYNLDLSYNRLSGTLSKDFYAQPRNFTFDQHFERRRLNFTELQSTAALKLSNNRLSGNIPSRAREITNITILTANVFSCRIDKSDLPRHDHGEVKYSCGSNSFNVPYIAWLGIVSAALVAAATAWHYRARLEPYLSITALAASCQRWLAILQPETETVPEIAGKLVNVRYVAKVFKAVEQATLWSTVYILFVLLPIFVAEAYLYGTHTEQYAYALSATFLSGVTPFALQLVAFAVLLILLVVGAIHRRGDFESDPVAVASQSQSQDDCSEETEQEQTWSLKTRRVLVRVAYFSINLIVVLGVNIAFVVVALYESTVLLLVAQVLLSVFKVLWNLVCSPFLIRWTAHYLSSTATAGYAPKRSREVFFSLQMFVSLFNNIAIPCLVVAVVDPNCFYNVFVPAETEESHYLYAVCKVYAFQGCLHVVPQVATASYDPPFDYSYQCSSSFITYYAPTFVFMCFVAMFGSPFLQLCALWTLRALPDGSWLHAVVAALIPPVWLPVVASPTQPVKRRIFRPYFDANLLISTLITYLGVMLTFGAVFPPLAAALALSMAVMSYFSKLKIGRLLCAAVDADRLVYLDIVEEECAGAGAVMKLRQGLRFVVCFSCMFYTLFLFDALGNARGFAGAVWVIFVVPLTPPVIYIAVNFYSSFQRSRRRRGGEKTETSGATELVSLSKRPEDPQDSIEISEKPGKSCDEGVLSALHSDV